MRITHRRVGYDKQTDRMRLRFDIPDHLMPEAKKSQKFHRTIPTRSSHIR